MSQTPDLVAVLEAIKAEAERGRKNLALHPQVRGTCSLQNIKLLADDALHACNGDEFSRSPEATRVP